MWYPSFFGNIPLLSNMATTSSSSPSSVPSTGTISVVYRSRHFVSTSIRERHLEASIYCFKWSSDANNPLAFQGPLNSIYIRHFSTSSYQTLPGSNQSLSVMIKTMGTKSGINRYQCTVCTGTYQFWSTVSLLQNVASTSIVDGSDFNYFRSNFHIHFSCYFSTS